MAGTVIKALSTDPRALDSLSTLENPKARDPQMIVGTREGEKEHVLKPVDGQRGSEREWFRL